MPRPKQSITAEGVQLIAAALYRSRPTDLLYNQTTRHQWYADVSSIATALNDAGALLNAHEFFNTCGVPD